LQSIRNLGLLLHLLGLRVPDDALSGLDGVLIGLRLRELLQQLLEARCKLSPVVMVFEDLHWIDSASEELLGKIVDGKPKLRLLLVTTRRLEYTPPWRDRPAVANLLLERLAIGDIRLLVQARLNVHALPETLVRHLKEKAEGNPLFAEEIVSYLTERGIVRTASGKLEFNDSTVAGALPANVQSLLASRIDRLSPDDRALLQAASVVGRRFDPLLLAVAVNDTDVGDRLAAMQSLDLVYRVGKSDDYSFKHALVRDALYQSLLSEARSTLHAKIGKEIERRGGNRLPEVAEILAYHYSRTNMADKAFAYLLMAGSKALDVYSLDEATTHLTAALALLEQHPTCASDNEFAKFFVAYSSLLSLSGRWKTSIDTLERHFPRIDRLGDDPSVLLIRVPYVLALAFNARYRDAAAAQRKTLEMAHRLGDSKSKAYALASEIFVSTIVDPKPLNSFESLKREATDTASEFADANIRLFIGTVTAVAELARGRINEARAAAHEFMRVGKESNDPRSTGLGLMVLACIAVISNSYAEALEYSERCLTVAITPQDRGSAIDCKAAALVLLRRTEEGAKLLEERRRQSLADGYNYGLAGTDGLVGVCKILQGNMAEGIHIIEHAILIRETEGYRGMADWYRLMLCDVYLQIIGGNEKLPLPVLLRNLPIILKVFATASARIRTLVAQAIENPQLDPNGYFVGWANMILGMLYKIKKKDNLAIQYLMEARRILSEVGPTPTLARMDAALAELEQYGSRPAQLRAEPMLLNVEHLVVEYGTGISRLRAVSDVSFDLKRGETLGFVGESGCGKSTLARAVLQLLRPKRGKVIFDGLDIARENSEQLRRLRRRIQLIFQDPIASLNPRRRVGEIVAEPLVIAGVSDRGERQRRVRAVLQAVGLDPDLVMRRRPHEFSGGQCQRISIARALVLEPELIICDEPVSALDVSIRAQILNLLEDMKARYGLTLIFIAHDLAVVKAISDRVAVMYLGKLCEIGPAEQVFETPAHPYTSLLLQAIPSPDPDTKLMDSIAAGEPPSPYAPPSGCRFHTRCPSARALCTDEEPIMREIRAGQFVACHFAA
jgi:oligopeptide/dipeptide ABC transporter ATP-binding protein